LNAGNRLASPAMGDDAGEALLAPMNRAELSSRAIIEILPRRIHVSTGYIAAVAAL
jgi:hypothetical protein